MTYNTMYERLIDQGQNTVQGYIAYGLYKNAKRQWVSGYRQQHNRDPKPAEVKAFVDSFTDQTIQALETQAAGVLAQFADGAIGDAKPEIVETALKGGFWRSVGQSVSANVLYTLGLIAVVLILKSAGIDLLSIASAS